MVAAALLVPRCEDDLYMVISVMNALLRGAAGVGGVLVAG